MGSLCNKLLDLFVLGAKRGGKRRLTSDQVLLLDIEQVAVLHLVGLVLESLGLCRLPCLVEIGLLQKELPLALAQLDLGGPQIFPSLVKPGFHLGDMLLEVHPGLVHNCHPGVHLLLASPMESLELVEVSAHGLKELVLLGATAADARFVNNLEPGSGEDLFVKDIPFDWLPQ